ncbi:histone acetyltransferases subunit 3-domain-containing protein, partial [Melampsora americana]
PYPKSQSEVISDFSKTKVTGAQVPIVQFQNWVHEHYLRSYGEDDLAFLSNKEDDQGVDEVPCLGTHYSEVWKSEDTGTSMLMKEDEEGGRGGKRLEKIKREEIHDGCFGNESLESGPLTERLIGSLQALKKLKHTLSSQTQPLINEGMGGNGGDNGVKMDEGNVSEKVVEGFKEIDPMDVEAKMLKELRYVGLLDDDEEVDWSKREDDEISISLRLTQKTLKKQIEINESRKKRISEIVKLRMGYQEYETLKDGLDRVIELAWTKRLKK